MEPFPQDLIAQIASKVFREGMGDSVGDHTVPAEHSHSLPSPQTRASNDRFPPSTIPPYNGGSTHLPSTASQNSHPMYGSTPQSGTNSHSGSHPYASGHSHTTSPANAYGHTSHHTSHPAQHRANEHTSHHAPPYSSHNSTHQTSNHAPQQPSTYPLHHHSHDVGANRHATSDLGHQPSNIAHPHNSHNTGVHNHTGGSHYPLASHNSGDHSVTEGLRKFVIGVRSQGVTPRQSEANHLQQRMEPRHRGSAAPFALHTPGAFDVQRIRDDFPILRQRVHGHPIVWFDNAATTQKPQSVIDAISRFYESDNSNIHRGAHSLAARATDAYEGARETVSRFLGASSSRDIVFARGTTEAINLVANTFGRRFLRKGDEIILSMAEHHANIVPWQMAAKRRGAIIRVIPLDDRGDVMLDAYASLLSPRTKMVALTQASNSLGTILPIELMSAMAKSFGAKVLIDGAQSVSHMPVDVRRMGADFFVFSGHKLFGPTGIGALYLSPEMQESLPPWQGGGNMIKNVTFDHTTYSEAPAKFEAGTPNIADAVGLGAAIDYVLRVGLENIGSYEHALLENATHQLAQVPGIRLIGTSAHKVSVLSFVLDGFSTELVGKALDREGIAVRAGHHCAQPSLRRYGVETTVRPSFSMYNTHSEIDHLAHSLHKIRSLGPARVAQSIGH